MLSPFFPTGLQLTPHAPLALRAVYFFVGALVHSIVNNEDVRCFDRPRTPCLAIHVFNDARLTTCGPCQHSLTPINLCQVRALVSCLAFCQHGLPRFTHSVTMITSRCLIVIWSHPTTWHTNSQTRRQLSMCLLRYHRSTTPLHPPVN